MPVGPRDRDAVAGSAEVRGHLLHPLERRVERPGPADVVVVFAADGAEVVDVVQQPLRILGHAVLVGRGAPAAVDGALRRGAVVSADVDEQGVVQLAEFVDGVDDPADLGVGMGHEPGEHLHQPAGHRLVAIVVVGPGRNLRRPRSQPGAGRDDARLELAVVSPLPQGIPAIVELSGEPVRPLRPDMVRAVRRAGSEVGEERLVRCGGLLQPDPFDCLVGEVLGEVVVLAAHIRLDGRGLVVQGRFVLRGLAAEEAVEPVESKSGRPAVERTRRAQLPHRGDVSLAEPGGAVAVHPQGLGDSGRALRDHAVVAREAVGDLADRPHVCAVVVAAGQQRCARRRAQRGGVELVVAQPRVGDPVECGGRHRAAERRRGAEAHVVEKDDDDVGRPGGRVVDRRFRRSGVFGERIDDPGERFLGVGQVGHRSSNK